MLFTISPHEYANDINTDIGVIFGGNRKEFIGIKKPFSAIVFKDTEKPSDGGPTLFHAEQLQQFLDQYKDANHIAFVCAQGVSRSSAALLFALRYVCNYPDSEIETAYKALYNILPNKLYLSYLDMLIPNPILPLVKTLPKGTRFKKNKKITLEVVKYDG